MVEGPEYSSSTPLVDLTAAAVAGDAGAWEWLVRRLERVVWKAVNMMTTDDDVRTDAFAATWLRLVERLGTIREPEKLPGWLTTTATNEVRRILRHRGRQHVSVDWSAPPTVFGDLLRDTSVDEHDRDLVRSETNRAVRNAFDALDADCRQILTVLVLEDPPLSYREASELLQRPIGALGPSRRRCLEKLGTIGGFEAVGGRHD
jgi:RNA polymerase sigma factor (sigma-70 family)